MTDTNQSTEAGQIYTINFEGQSVRAIERSNSFIKIDIEEMEIVGLKKRQKPHSNSQSLDFRGGK